MNSSADESTMQLIIDQVEELVVTLYEEIRERPAVAMAILAGLVGAAFGTMIAGRLGRRTAPAPVRAAHRGARDVSQAADLVGVGFKLLQNPIVRGAIVSVLESQFKKRLSR